MELICNDFGCWIADRSSDISPNDDFRDSFSITAYAGMQI